MAKPFSALPGILREREREYFRGVDRIARGAAREAGRTMASTTRVDTGLARSNYQATLGAPSATVVPPYAPGELLGIGEQGNLIGVTSQQRNVIRTWQPGRGIPLFITNNVPYIGILNFGGRNVGPGNMLRLGFQAAVTFVKSHPRVLR